MRDSNLKTTWDEVSSFVFAKEEVEAIGFETGKRKAALKIAGRMKEYGIPTDKIAKITELSLEEIEKL